MGGIFEVIAHHVPVGLGSHAQWDEKLDGRLAQAVMSIQAVKAVEIGAGVAGEAMVALVLADAFLQKFGGDSLAEMQRNFNNYARQIDEF